MDSETQAVLRLEDVSKRYPSVAKRETDYVLKGINWQVAAGKTIAITGPSGSGKSTLLNLIGTLDRPTSGQVWLDGSNSTTMSDVDLAHLRNQQIGFVFQLHHLLPQCTVWENVLIPTLPMKDSRPKAIHDRAGHLLERVGLADRLYHRPGQLSGGEQQRVAVVRALINQPKLLLADEPTGSLDGRASQVLADLLLELNQEEQITLIVATHSMKLARRMQQVWSLENQTLVLEDES